MPSIIRSGTVCVALDEASIKAFDIVHGCGVATNQPIELASPNVSALALNLQSTNLCSIADFEVFRL